MYCNIGRKERPVRIILGIVFLLLGISNLVVGILSIVLIAIGVILLLTGISGFCGLYKIMNFHTKDDNNIDKITKKDIEDAVKKYHENLSSKTEQKKPLETKKTEDKKNTKNIKETKSKSNVKINPEVKKAQKKSTLKTEAKTQKTKKNEEKRDSSENVHKRISAGNLPKYPIETVLGVGKRNANKLKKIDIDTTAKFLEKASTKKGRTEISKQTGIDTKKLLDWANHIDLFRIKGIRENFANLLHEAGVDTVPELASRNPENLLQSLKEINQTKKLVRILPSEKQANDWVEHAKTLKKIITH